MTALADPTGKVVLELRADAALTALVAGRVDAGEPADGHAKGPGEYLAFVVVMRGFHRRLAHAPVQSVQYVVRCYGATHQGATAVAMAVSGALHAKGNRLAGGISIFDSIEQGSTGGLTDPDTKQPYMDVLFTVGASTELIT